MSRVLLSCLLLLLVISPASAQSDPLYIECGAEDYLIQRHYARQPVAEWTDLYGDRDMDAGLYSLFIVAVDKYMTGLLAIEDVPECVQALHTFSLQAAYNSIFVTSMFLASRATLNPDYAFNAGQRSTVMQDLNMSINDELLALGWIDENGDVINEPPPLEVEADS